MTNKQMKVFEVLKRGMADSYGEEYEIKEATIQPLKFCNDVKVVITMGMKNDEGTLAEIYARDSIRVFIGTRGGVTYFVQSDRAKDGYVERRWDGGNPWLIYFEQKYDEKERRGMSK